METAEEFWNNWEPWSVVEDYTISYGVQNMSHDEIVAAILDDLLRVRLEFAEERPHGLHWYDVLRFLKTNRQKERVLEALCDARVEDLAAEDKEEGYEQFINLRADRITLQAAMDIAGCWYEGYEVPDGVTTYSFTEKGAALIGELGVEDFVKRLAHEFDTGEKMLP